MSECCCDSPLEMEQCDCHKTKERDPEEYKRLMNRLSRIEGQIRAAPTARISWPRRRRPTRR